MDPIHGFKKIYSRKRSFMKTYLTVLGCFFILASCNQTDPQQPQPVDQTKEVENNLIPPVYIEGDPTWTIEERMEHYGVPGVSLAVIHKGEIVWTKAYGIMDKDSKIPVTTETLFQAASISKPVSAYAALRLVEQGKIDLEANINSQLKSWQLEENEFTAAKKVTLKNLLNHSAGTTVHGFGGYSPGTPVPSLLQVLDGLPPANSNAIVVDKEPEKSFRYSGGGYNVVQQLLIDVEGKSYPEIMEEQVLKPLGMNHSSFKQPLDEAQLSMAATGYLPNGTMTMGKRHTYPEMAAAGLWTTAADLATFALNIQKTLEGKSERGLSKAMTTTMLTPFVEDHVGLGMFLRQKQDEVYFEHGGWNEGFSSQLMAHKEDGYGVVVMINSNHPAFIEELIRSVALTYGWKDYFPRYAAVETDAEFMASCTGRYLAGGFETIEIEEDGGQLTCRQWPAEERIPLVRVSNNTFVTRGRADIAFQFSSHADDDSIGLSMVDPRNQDVLAEYEKVLSSTLLPSDLIKNGDYEEALVMLKAIREKDASDPAVDEDNINMLGYQFMWNDQKEVARHIFEMNMILYPESFNVYDSYAEACMELGEYDLAIEYYQKSLELNPKNAGAQRQIERIKARE